MPTQPLHALPNGSDVFIDANIFVYGLNGQSPECRQLLDRCSREEIAGIAAFTVLNEATHRFMLAEALSLGFISRERARDLRANSGCIPQVTSYWIKTQSLLSLNLLFLPLDQSVIRSAQRERQIATLLTNDSIIAAVMREYGISLLATSDSDFERVAGITVYKPTDLS